MERIYYKGEHKIQYSRAIQYMLYFTVHGLQYCIICNVNIMYNLCTT
jgi:hypothetical protein